MESVLARISARIDQLPLARYPHRERTLFSVARAPDILKRRLSRCSPDLLHLHWINNGYMKIETLPKFKKPIVWTFHDMWPITGGCHYSNGCQKYMHSCGSCPQLHSSNQQDLSYDTFTRKKNAWGKTAINVVTPSRWLADTVLSSEVMRHTEVQTIPNTIDMNKFAPTDKRAARSEFGLPTDGTVLLFGALTSDGDKRKGFHFLAPLLHKLAENPARRQNIHLAVLGMREPEDRAPLPFPVTYLGVLNADEAIARAYSSADVLIVPSMEDNLPNAVMEAASCGVPSVAFKIGGLADLIEHRQSGYLAEPFDIDDFAAGVSFLIEDREVALRVGKFARQHVSDHYSYSVVARQHIELYSKLLAN